MQNASTLRGGPRWFKTVDMVLDRVAGVFLTLAEAMLAVMLVINVVNIALRNSGQASLLWVSPWTGVMMVWCVFLTFYVLYRRNLDIALLIIVGRLSPLGLKVSRVLTAVAGLLVVSVLVAEAPQIIARQRGMMELIGLTRYWLSVPLIASSIMLVFHFVFDLVAVLCGWTEPDTVGDEERSQW